MPEAPTPNHDRKNCHHLFYQNILPNSQPETVDMTTTKATYTAVFFTPSTLLITSMLGNDSEGPDSNNANAGPLPMPEARSPCTMGTSVKVAKYIKAPVKLARKFDRKELPPTAYCIHSLGITPATDVLP